MINVDAGLLVKRLTRVDFVNYDGKLLTRHLGKLINNDSKSKSNPIWFRVE